MSYAGLRVHEAVALRGAGDPVRVLQAGVEPLRRVRGADLRGEHPAELVVERLRVLGRVEVAVLRAPVGPAAGEAVEHLARVALAAEDGGALRVAERLAVRALLRHAGLPEVLLREDVHRDLRPRRGDVDALELEDGGPVGVADLRRA